MTSPCPLDLLGLRRAGQLSPAQARLLDEHLQSCAACAMDEGLHESFENAGRPRAMDQELIARVVDRAMLRRRSPRGRQARSLAIGIALALLMAGGLASAAAWLYQRISPAARPGPAAIVPAASPAMRPSPPAPAAPIVVPEIVVPAPAPVEQPRAPAARPHAHHRATALEEPPAAPALDLKSLFAAANEARRAGQLDRAGELYAELQSRFPDSREAQLSLVSYGRILLERGRVAEALPQFERYLRTATGGVLAAEALYGQARALTHLHRDPEARGCWADLLSRFPDSIYADVARTQLGTRP